MSFSRGLESFPFRRSLVALVVSAVVLGGCSDGGDGPAEVSKTVEIPADADGDVAGSEAATGEDAPIPIDEFDPSEYEVGDVVPEVEIVKPVVYPEMKNFDEAGAEAAAQYMIDVLNYTYNTGDTSFLNAVASDKCSLCGEVSEHIESIESQKGMAVGPVYSVAKVEVFDNERFVWILNSEITYEESVVIDSKRLVIGHLPGSGKMKQQIVLRGSNVDGWKFTTLGGVAFE